MSISLLEVIEAAGYDLNTLEDAAWLKSKGSEWDELLDKAEAMLNEAEEREMAEHEAEYRRRWGSEQQD